jgi:hypothetical protein
MLFLTRQAIQQALIEQRNASPPAAIQSAVIHPDRKFSVLDLSIPAIPDVYIFIFLYIYIYYIVSQQQGTAQRSA